jgi:hypothetical protein
MKMGLAILMALLFAVLGLIGGLGYHVLSLQQLSFYPHDILGYADATISFSAIYNPILYPFYWIVRSGSISGNFSLMYLPEARVGEFLSPVWGLKPSDRYDYYTIQMVTWGFWSNLICLLFITVLIEVASARALYLAMLSGILGFYVAEVFGMLTGLVAGCAVVYYLTFKLSKDNVLLRFWHSLWE